MLTVVAITEPRVERSLENGTLLRAEGGLATRGKPTFRADIQGLRAVALIIILLYHAGIPGTGGGFIGPDVFFVISGFLITGNLMSSPIVLRSFYAKRMRRLVPASVLVAVLTLVAAAVLLPPLLVPAVARDGMAAGLNLTNMWLAWTGTDYLGAHTPSLFQHYWSLALEEQFYLLWPVILLLLARPGGGRMRRTLAWTAGLTAASLALCIWYTPIDRGWAYFLLPTRAWEFGAGALLWLLAGRPGAPAHRIGAPLTRVVIGWAGVAGLIGAVMFYNTTMYFPGTLALLPVLATLAVIFCGATPGGPITVLAIAPMQFLGRISYSYYLWHWPVLVLAAVLLGRTPTVVEALALLALAGVAAWLTYLLVENPLRRARWLTTGTGRTVAAAAGAVAVVVVFAVAITPLPRLSTDTVAPAPTAESVATGAFFGSDVPANITPTLAGAAADVPAVYSDGCEADVARTDSPLCRYGAVGSARKVVLFGDSRASQWFTPLASWATARGLELVVITKSGCPPARIPVLLLADRRPFPQCASFRENALRTIATLDPELVVLGGYGAGYRDLWTGTTGRNSGGYDAAYAAGITDTIDRLPLDAATVVLGETPTWVRDPAVCLSAHLRDTASCTRPLTEAVDPASSRAQQVAVARTGALYVDPAPWLCSQICYPLAGNQLLYRDDRHISDGAARLLAPMVAAALDRALDAQRTRP